MADVSLKKVVPDEKPVGGFRGKIVASEHNYVPSESGQKSERV